ncbi:hypothetical protein NQ315_006222 [Exocentrus adspersus]|uniref:Uncharacterized protein n=1 Tax=Exocentrus adspersus TaxID=1586481 RepID=A0AAV8W067_9CUCU|nr:hypothetical protein NQ315_006222 [Exocentrus adspersus]
MAKSDFVNQFYNIHGDLYPLTEEDLESLHPRTYLESLFQIDVFIYFKLHKKLLDVIKGGHEVFISKALKHPLLLKEAIGYVTAESFVNDFLPCTSYTMRMKVVKKMSFYLDELQMDEVVSCMYKRYGLNTAQKILHTCSSSKVREFLTNHEIILRARQIKYIFDKDPKLFTFFLLHYKVVKGSAYNHRNLSRYVAAKDIAFWKKLKEEELLHVQLLGRRTGKKYISHNTAEVLDNIRPYTSFLPLKVMLRKLQGHFHNLYLKMDELSAYDFCTNFLNCYPRNKQWQMFAQTFEKVFGSSVVDNLICLEIAFYDLFPDKSIRNKWGQVQYDSSKEDQYLKYCDPLTAVPLIKDKINVTSDIHQRTTLVKLLIDNCVENKDWATFEGVLKYISVRHRNEDSLEDILFKIKEADLDALNKNHWTYIIEIVTFLRVKKLLKFHNGWYFLVKFIEYSILHGEPYLKELTMYIEDVHKNWGSFPIELDNPEIKKQIFIDIIKIYRNIVKDQRDFNTVEVRLINSIIEFNLQHPECAVDISTFPDLMETIKSLLDKDACTFKRGDSILLQTIISNNLVHADLPVVALDEAKILEILRRNYGLIYDVRDALVKRVTKIDRSKFEDDVLELVWGNVENTYVLEPIVRWFYQKQPRSIVPHFDRILPKHSTYISVNCIKCLSHLGFDQKVKDYCMEKLNLVDSFLDEKMDTDTTKKVEEQKVKVDSWIIDALSVLLNTKEYLETVVDRLVPTKKKISAEDEELHEIYELQCRVGESLKKIKEPALALPAVLKFCVGDYLQATLPALYSICYRSAENTLPPYMNMLSKTAVSARKHAVFLTCELLDYNSAVNTLSSANRSHVSSEKHIFSATLKYFRKNPTAVLFNLVMDNVNTINENDKETLGSLVSTKLPKKYVALFIEKCWYFLESLKEKDVKVESYLNSFLGFIVKNQKVFISLPESFCRHIIGGYFKKRFSSDFATHLDQIKKFVCIVLQYRVAERADNFKFVFNIISTAKKERHIDFIQDFFSKWQESTIEDMKSKKKLDNDYVELFRQHWSRIFTRIEMFNQHMLLDLLSLENRSASDENYAQELLLYLEKLVTDYGPYIYYIFKEVLPSSTFATKEKYSVLYQMLTYKKSTLSCILVLDLIGCRPYSADEAATYNKIKEMLIDVSDPIVCIYWNNQFGYKN